MTTLPNMDIALMTLGILLLVAAAIDVRSHRIPNVLTLPIVCLAMGYHTISEGAGGFAFSILGASVGVGLLVLPYIMGGMGAGDAKLMGAVGSVVGAKGVFLAFLLTAIVGGIYSILFLMVHRSKFKGFMKNQIVTLQLCFVTRNYIPDPISESQGRPRLCYGVAIALGSITYIVLTLSGYSFPI
jgi:prepilin peptidase CpaA